MLVKSMWESFGWFPCTVSSLSRTRSFGKQKFLIFCTIIFEFHKSHDLDHHFFRRTHWVILEQTNTAVLYLAFCVNLWPYKIVWGSREYLMNQSRCWLCTLNNCSLSFPQRAFRWLWHLPGLLQTYGSSMDWHPYSPDFTPFDICLWGVLPKYVHDYWNSTHPCCMQDHWLQY